MPSSALPARQSPCSQRWQRRREVPVLLMVLRPQRGSIRPGFRHLHQTPWQRRRRTLAFGKRLSYNTAGISDGQFQAPRARGLDNQVIPASRFDTYNNAYLEAQSAGKGPGVSRLESAFIFYYLGWDTCADINAEQTTGMCGFIKKSSYFREALARPRATSSTSGSGLWAGRRRLRWQSHRHARALPLRRPRRRMAPAVLHQRNHPLLVRR